MGVGVGVGACTCASMLVAVSVSAPVSMLVGVSVWVSVYVGIGVGLQLILIQSPIPETRLALEIHLAHSAGTEPSFFKTHARVATILRFSLPIQLSASRCSVLKLAATTQQMATANATPILVVDRAIVVVVDDGRRARE